MKIRIPASLVFISLVCLGRAEQPVKNIPYLEFLTAVDEGKIRDVRFTNLMGLEGEMQSTDGIVRFSSTRPMQTSEDPLLLRYLENRKVKITKIEQSQFPSSSVHFSGFFLAMVMFIIAVVVACLSFTQLVILRRLEKKANQQSQPTSLTGRG